MENNQAAQERDRIRQEDRERANKERGQFSIDRAQEITENNLRKKETKQNALSALQSEEVKSNLIRTVNEGGSVGRRMAREIQRAESTGRISNWLANQTTKAELNVGRERQEQFNTLVSSVSTAIESPVATAFGGLFKYKPEVPSGQEPNCVGLALYIRNKNIWIRSGRIAGRTISGMDPKIGMFISSGGNSGYVWAKIKIDDLGRIQGVDIGSGAIEPDNTDTSFYYTLGRFDGTDLTNYGCGSVDVIVCRLWFTTTPPLYNVIFSR